MFDSFRSNFFLFLDVFEVAGLVISHLNRHDSNNISISEEQDIESIKINSLSYPTNHTPFPKFSPYPTQNPRIS